jgi:hypothetical protein
VDSAHSTSHGKRSAPFQHAFAGHRLLEIPALIELSRELPRASIRFHAAAMKETTNFGDVGSIPKAGSSLEDALAHIEESGSWVQLNHIETVPAYGQLIDEFLAEVRHFVGVDRRAMHRREAHVFVGSPGSLTPFHCETEPQFVCQARGRKDLYVWDPNDRVVLSQEQLEALHGDYAAASIRYRPALMGRARLFPLEPGNGAFVPQDAPHMVKTGERAAVTLSISYFGDEARRRRDVYAVNHLIRKWGSWAGVSPRDYGEAPLLDSLKHRLVTVYEGTRRHVLRHDRGASSVGRSAATRHAGRERTR